MPRQPLQRAEDALRVVIADDEALARERLRRLLDGQDDVKIVAECSTGHETISAIRSHAPDVVFLDVRMPELDGFEVVAALDGGPSPAVVFVTAHDRFAVQAFECHAVDYIVKPVGRERLRAALDRARQRLGGTNGTSESLVGLLVSLKAKLAPPPDRIPIRSADRITLLKVAELDWVSSADNYVELHIGETTHLLRATISSFADQLPATEFARISRSTIVNVARVVEIRLKAHGDFEVHLYGGARLHGTRNYRESLDALVKKSTAA